MNGRSDRPTGSDVTLIVGAGGLLGSGLRRHLRERRRRLVVPDRVEWSDASAAVRVLARSAAQLLAEAGDGPWRIAWCAGAGVTATPQDVLDRELAVIRGFLEALDAMLTPAQREAGTFFLASSAGGVYAGGANPPFTELSPVQPLAPYGRAKLVSERLVTQFAQESGVSAVIGRISNLYGPGQNLAKPQGLISVLCRAHVMGQPSLIYVPLDTIRDYLFVDDAAAMVAAALDGARDHTRPEARTIIKILATQRSTSIGALLGECRRVFGRKPRVVLGASPVAKFQSLDLRMRSVVWTELDDLAPTTLATGVHRTLLDVTSHVRS